MRYCLEKSQEGVEGTVTLDLYRGAVYIQGRRSPLSLYNKDLVRRVLRHQAALYGDREGPSSLGDRIPNVKRRNGDSGMRKGETRIRSGDVTLIILASPLRITLILPLRTLP